MDDIDRRPHNDAAAQHVHLHKCPECNVRYNCNCSEADRKESLVCRDCERGIKTERSNA